MTEFALESVEGTNFTILTLAKSIEWWDVYKFIDEFNAQKGARAKLIGFDATRNFPYSSHVWAQYRFPADAIVAYERADTPFGPEIVYDPPQKGAPKAKMRTGKFQGQQNVALLAFGLSAHDFHKEGKETLVRVSEDRLRSVRIDERSVTNGEHVARTADVVFQSKTRRAYIGPIVVYLSNYDVSFSFGATNEFIVPRFDQIIVELS